MSRTHAQALVLVNWKGVFYERYLIDRHVTALEGANGAGKTTVMIAAYVVLLPDMSRLRFTNLGETGATGGDKGIWGRLGEPGRPSYSAIDFALATGQRLIAGVHLERKGEPSVEPTPFIVSDLDADARLQELLLLTRGEHDVVPELSELRENAARLGGRLQLFNSARDYFAALFEQGVMPLRLGTDEERNKLNEMLRTSMTGGISRALTSELRSFLLKEEGGLADTVQRMKANLDACRRTRTEVQESQRLVREIGGVLESGQSMFAAAVLATRERADELRRRLTEAREAQREAQLRLAEVEDRLVHLRDEVTVKESRQDALTRETRAAEDWHRRLQQALEAAQEVAHWREKLSAAAEIARRAAAELAKRDEIRTRCQNDLDRCQRDHRQAAEGLADLQCGLEELHRRAGLYKQVVRRKSEAEQRLRIDVLATDAMSDQIAAIRMQLTQLNRERRAAKQRRDDAGAHRQEHAVVVAALERMAKAPIEPSGAHAAALQQLGRWRDLQLLAERRSLIAAELADVRPLARRQAETRALAEQLGLSFSGQRSADLDITEHLEGLEKERERLLQQAAEARADVADCQRTLDGLRTRRQELSECEPLWRDLVARAQPLADELGSPVASRSDLQAARECVKERLDRLKASESERVATRERLHAEARELLAAGGPFDPELLRLKETLGAELLAGAFEDIPLEEAAVLEASLGPLVQALVVDDPATAARQVQGRDGSLSDVWLVSRDADAAQLGAGQTRQRADETDVVVVEPQAIRVTRLPTHPRLGRKAREQRAAELRAEADALDAGIEAQRTERRRLDRLAEDSEVLLANQALWLGGDPALELTEIQRRLLDVEAQQERHSASASQSLEAARALEPRLAALRTVLGSAMLLDPPDHAQRRDRLEREHAEAQAAQTETQRCREAARVVEDGLEVLRRPPLSDSEVADLETQLEWLSDECERLEAAVEALEFVAANVVALSWDDAPEQLEHGQSLVPALKEQSERARAALDAAQSALNTAEQAFSDTTSAWHEAEGTRATAATQFEAADARFRTFGIAEPTPAAVDAARADVQRLMDEGQALQAELADLRTRLGRHEAERDQANTAFQAADKKVADERREAEPAFERWERLRRLVDELRLLPSQRAGDSDLEAIRGHVNLVQEARQHKAVLVERLRAAQGARELLAKFDAVDKAVAGADLKFAEACLELWQAVRDWLLRRLPAQVADVDDPQEALYRLRDQLAGLEERLARQEGELRGASEDVARGIDVQIRKARGQVNRLNQNLDGVSFGSIQGIRVRVQPVERMEQVLRALREGAVQGLLFQENLPIEDALDEIFRRYGGGRSGGQRLLDYREYVHLQVEVRRNVGSDWEIANPTRLSTGEAIGVGAALMMVVLTEWERDANLLRGKRAHGSLRFLFLDEANRLSHDNLGVLFDLCRTLDLQLLIAAPEVARADGNTTYRLVRRVDGNGREDVLVSGRRTRA